MSEMINLRDETRRIISGEESRIVEYKESLSGLDSEDLVAFANAEGGSIIIGVKEQTNQDGRQYGEIIGCAISDRSKLSVISKANNCRPPIEIEIIAEHSNQGDIYRIDIASSTRKPVCTMGGTYKIRREGANSAINPELMTSIIFQREEEEFLHRFREAGQTIINRLGAVEEKLGGMIVQVEIAASEAAGAARDAAGAAEDAMAAAEL